MNPSNTVFDVLRLVDRKFSDPSVQADAKLWPFKIVGKLGRPAIQLGYKGETKLLWPVEILAMLLRYLKEIAQANLGELVSSAVISTPCYFNCAQRQLVRDAAEIAGLNCLRLGVAPVFAAVTYGLNKTGGERNVL